MFVFQEGEQFPIFQFERNIQVCHLMFKEAITFRDAIVQLASRMRRPNQVFIFWNFFSKGCQNLAPYEKRGLERMALGENAIELYHEAGRQTRFILSVDVKHIRDRSLPTMIQSIMQDKTSFGIGNFRKGNILLVGDTPGAKALGYNTPFVGSGSGLWLLKQLEAAGLLEDKYYWINAKDNFGIDADQCFLDELKPKRIIALGNEAAKWAQPLYNRYQVLHCPHPQFWLRFRGREEYPLLKIIK